MTDEEANRVRSIMEAMTPERLKQVDKSFDEFITKMCDALGTFAEVHKAEMLLLGKTSIIISTDDIIKRQGESVGELSEIGDKENLAALYRALGEELREQGVLEEDEG